jgi:SAM-dependent methyltransferase
METSAGLVLGLIGLTIAIALLWRLASHRHALPCPVWLGWLVELDNPITRTNRAAAIVENLGLAAGMSVVDIGCGPGRVTIPLAKRVGAQGTVVAMDMQAGMLSRVKVKAAAEGLTNIESLQAGVGDGQLGDARFDRALLVTVLGEIPEQTRALREVLAALAPRRRLVHHRDGFRPPFSGPQHCSTTRQRRRLSRAVVRWKPYRIYVEF